MSGLVSKLRRQAAFARGIPPRQIARRVQLALRRRYERIRRPSLEPGELTRSAYAPRPIFPPRAGVLERTEQSTRVRLFGRSLPLTFGRDLDRRACGESQLVLMTVHYMEYLEEVDDAEFGRWVLNWINLHPPYAFGASSDSWNAYALSLRVVVWMQQLAIRAERLDDSVIAAAEASIARQLLYLERHMETDIGGNHLIKNIKALLWASAYFRGAAAERWRRRGTVLLVRELPTQILPDGMHYELSPGYHCQVFADLLEIRHALDESPARGMLDDALRRAAQVVADLTHPDGAVAQFGDTGLSMAYAPKLGLEVFGKICGKAPAPRPAFSFPNAGYYGAREGGDYVVADAGPIGPDVLPGHAHGDAFSFEWSLGGQRIIVDQGVFEYVAGLKRSWARSAAAHNTVSVRGADQADFFGDFRRGTRPRVEVVSHASRSGGFSLVGRHDGFRRTAGGPVHSRAFDASPTRLVIVDRLDKPWPGACSSLLFSPEVQVEQHGPCELLITCRGVQARITATGALRLEEALWWPDMGVEIETQRAVLAFSPEGTEARIELTRLAGREGCPDEAS